MPDDLQVFEGKVLQRADEALVDVQVLDHAVGPGKGPRISRPVVGQWWWHSLQRGRFRYQRTSHRQLLLNMSNCQIACNKDENKEKEAENGLFFKK